MKIPVRKSVLHRLFVDNERLFEDENHTQMHRDPSVQEVGKDQY